MQPDPTIRNPAREELPSGRRRAWAAVIFAFAAILLAIGLGQDYRLKHEDNNALFATFARSHLQAGLSATRGQDAFFATATGHLSFYGHHPPGPGLALAAAFRLTGHDGPALVRSVAILFHLLGGFLLYRLLRDLVSPRQALLGGLFFAVLPQAAFFGRMLNHEPLALGAMVLLVDRYRAYLARGGGWPVAGIVTAALWGAAMAWAFFFVLGACAGDAMLRGWRGETRAARAAVILISLGILLFGLVLLQIAWVQGGLAELYQTFLSRSGEDSEVSPVRWLAKILGHHRRYFTTVGLIALLWLAGRGLRRGWLRARGREYPAPEAAESTAVLFLAAGVLYAVVFNAPAYKHHYWQYPLLPASVLALLLLMRQLFVWRRRQQAIGRGWVSAVVIALVVVEMVGTSAQTLIKRHQRTEPYAVETTQMLRENFL